MTERTSKSPMYRAGTRVARSGGSFDAAKKYASDHGLGLRKRKDLLQGFADEMQHNPNHEHGRPPGKPER
jgi:hypothetical protein